MNLDTLGWNQIFQFYFSELNDPLLIPARVTRVDRGHCLLLAETGSVTAKWQAPIPIPDHESATIPAVGDWCALSQQQGWLRLETILPRKTSMVRSHASGHRAEQILASNVDVAFLVTGLDKDFNLRRIERYLTLARASSVRPVVLLNKADLLSDPEQNRVQAMRVVPEATVATVSALTGEGVSDIAQELGPGTTGVFLGSSGAGKSTLINALLGQQRQTTNTVRDGDSHGRHTTTHRELILLDDGGIVIDTPGIRAVGILADSAHLEQAFPDVVAHSGDCKFTDCQHQGEPDCAVRAAVDRGDLEQDRLDSYLHLRLEAENAERRRDSYAQHQHERQTVGRYRGWLKEQQKFKGKL